MKKSKDRKKVQGSGRARCQVSGSGGAEAQGRRREPPAVSWMNQKLGRVLRQLREKLLALKAKIRAEWKSVTIIGPTLSRCGAGKQIGENQPAKAKIKLLSFCRNKRVGFLSYV